MQIYSATGSSGFKSIPAGLNTLFKILLISCLCGHFSFPPSQPGREQLCMFSVLWSVHAWNWIYLEILWRRRQWHPTPVLLPGKSHGQRSLVGCSPWDLKESDTTEWLHFHFSLSCIGEGNDNPFQCSCLENPRDGGAWWAAVYGVAQGRTRLKRLSSSIFESSAISGSVG